MNEKLFTQNEVNAAIAADREERELDKILSELEAEEDDYDFDYENQRACAVKVSKNRIVGIEELLMQLSMAQSVLLSVAEYAGNDDRDNLTPPTDWAVAGANAAIEGTLDALKCLCWGYRDAYNHY